MNHTETVEFLSGLGIAPTDILDDAPEAGLWVTAAGLRRLCDAAPSDVGTFSVRAMLTSAVTGATIIITRPEPLPTEPDKPKEHLPWLLRCVRRLRGSK